MLSPRCAQFQGSAHPARRWTVNPDYRRPVGFSFDASAAAPEDVHQTLEQLLALPGESAPSAAPRGLVLDGFQEIVDIDPACRGYARGLPGAARGRPRLPRQRRHMMRRLFSDENEPFWRSAKPSSSASSRPSPSARYIDERFARDRPTIEADALDALLRTTGGHPYATQELCYFLWQLTPRRAGRRPRRSKGRSRASCAPRTRTSPRCGTARRRSSACCCRRSPPSPAAR